MSPQSPQDLDKELNALRSVLLSLEYLDPAAKRRILKSAEALLGGSGLPFPAPPPNRG